MTKLIDICDIQYGYAFDSACFTEDDSYLPLVRIRDVKRGFSETFYSGEYPEEYVIHKGDLIVGMDGEFNIARWKSIDALLNQRVCKLKAKEGTNEEYLRFALVKALKTIEDKTAFVTVKHLSAKELNKLELDMPGIEEQNVRAESMAKLEKVISHRKEELSALDNLIKARFVEMFGNPVTNEKGWNQKQLGEITTKLGSGATPKGGKEAYQEDGITLIRSMNVHNGLFEYKELAHISEEQATKLDNVTIEENDVLLNITGASVARSCVVPSKILPARVNQHVCIIRCNQRIVPEFLNKLLIDDNYQRLLWSIARGGATREAITKQQVESLKIIVPPIELQNQFADFVHQVDKSKVTVQKAFE
ncbi:restriction endonuclease subunit S [Agathobacter rectalis]|uniref:EcoKI restriction-modification system protein HsdS n=1 Tax=Agathobacter rectalis TaxID=39491 RepID=A0A174A981_9FIRM|nr:restriction endonuclease subunit S [Agathobacter rectalis]CUN85212.1 EcoKI restriction-modification system protein HsdS [Agathobacter rectalis]